MEKCEFNQEKKSVFKQGIVYAQKASLAQL